MGRALKSCVDYNHQALTPTFELYCKSILEHYPNQQFTQAKVYGVITSPGLGECRRQPIRPNYWQRQSIPCWLHTAISRPSSHWILWTEQISAQHTPRWNSGFVINCFRCSLHDLRSWCLCIRNPGLRTSTNFLPSHKNCTIVGAIKA